MRLQLKSVAVALVASAMLASSSAWADEPAPAPEAPPAPAPEAPPAPAPEAPAPAPKRESDIDARASAEVSGYIDTVATTVLTPSVGATVVNPVAGWAASGRYLVDVVSAASPDIVATASPPFKEIRQAGSLGFRYKPGNFGVNGSALASYSPDYLSLGGGVDLIEDLDEKNYTLTQGYHYGHDVIGRAGTPFSVFSRLLDTHMVTLGASTVANPSLLLGITVDGIFERGNQSKPYRYIPIFSPDVAPNIPRGASVASVVATRLQARPLEQLPLERDRLAATAHVSWRRGATTLRMDERLYADSWAQVAATTDARYFIDLGRRIIFWPHVRFHMQNAVSFWQRAYSATGPGDLPALRTGDRELGALFNVGGGGGIRVAIGRRGRIDQFTWTTTIDGIWTSFSDALYIKTRWSSIATTGLEAAF